LKPILLFLLFFVKFTGKILFATKKFNKKQNTFENRRKKNVFLNTSKGEKMKLYHGSNQIVENPKLLAPTHPMDEGKNV
jgi:hypothetical protein